MNNLFTMSIVLFLFFQPSIAQTTITLQPNAIKGKDAPLFNCIPCGYNDQNMGSHTDFLAMAWTNSGNESTVRSLLEFDLSDIPLGATILNAELSLYFNPTNSNNGSQLGNNSAYLQRVVEAWDEFTVTWHNQPATTPENQVTLPKSTSQTQDYLDIDVKALVIDMLENPGQNHGFMIRLITEEILSSLVFATSDHINANLHPKLVITYTAVGIENALNPYNIELFPNPNQGKFFINNIEKINSIEVCNLTGSIVYKASNNKTSMRQVDLSALSRGLYIVRFYDDTESYIKRLVIH